jgi:hypothetical protein
MDTTVTFEYGPISVEIHAYEGESYQDEVLDLLQFIEQNQDRFDELEASSKSPEIHPEKTETASLQEFATEDQEGENTEEENSPLKSIASELHVDIYDLETFLYANPKDDEPPILYIDELDELGDKQADRQRIASLILLYTWHDCYGEERVRSSALKNALELSNISSSGMANMYQGEGDRYFDRRGRGPTATVKLTPPGKRQARKEIKKFAEEANGSQ